MLQINQLKLNPGYTEQDLIDKLVSVLRIKSKDIIEYHILRRSIDARKKDDIFMNLSVCVKTCFDTNILKRNKNNNICEYKPVIYDFKPSGSIKSVNRPVVIGSGPAGLFAALYLAKAGYKPLIIERGKDVDARTADLNNFFETGILNPESNVLFGEGGAGTFSDGKLNTLTKDKSGKNQEVLKTFVKYGAKEEILYDAKPHVGTDVLKDIVKNIRLDIEALGGEIRFEAKLTDLIFEGKKLKAIVVNDNETIPCDICVLAIGHSARDTFNMLYNKGIYLEQKDFAVGLRIEHKQIDINKALYTEDKNVLSKLPPAAYKLSYKASNGKGVYSFCMCPGGFVVNASSEEGCLCINGMSYSKRDGENANSAIVATVSAEEFKSDHPLAGIAFQREIERNAYNLAKGKIPVQTYKAYKADVSGEALSDDKAFGNVLPNTKGKYEYAKVSNILPSKVNEAIVEGIDYFERIIKGFSNDDALVSGVEARTSSPVRITRDESFFAIGFSGVIPCGEGAGYAGGITSAAMDGLRAYETIASIYAPF